MMGRQDLTDRAGPGAPAAIHDSLGPATPPAQAPPAEAASTNGHHDALAGQIARAALLTRVRGAWKGCTQCFQAGRDVALGRLEGVEPETLGARLALIRALGPGDQPNPHSWLSFSAGRDAVLAVMEGRDPS